MAAAGSSELPYEDIEPYFLGNPAEVLVVRAYKQHTSQRATFKRKAMQWAAVAYGQELVVAVTDAPMEFALYLAYRFTSRTGELSIKYVQSRREALKRKKESKAKDEEASRQKQKVGRAESTDQNDTQAERPSKRLKTKKEATRQTLPVVGKEKKKSATLIRPAERFEPYLDRRLDLATNLSPDFDQSIDKRSVYKDPKTEGIFLVPPPCMCCIEGGKTCDRGSVKCWGCVKANQKCVKKGNWEPLVPSEEAHIPTTHAESSAQILDSGMAIQTSSSEKQEAMTKKKQQEEATQSAVETVTNIDENFASSSGLTEFLDQSAILDAQDAVPLSDDNVVRRALVAKLASVGLKGAFARRYQAESAAELVKLSGAPRKRPPLWSTRVSEMLEADSFFPDPDLRVRLNAAGVVISVLLDHSFISASSCWKDRTIQIAVQNDEASRAVHGLKQAAELDYELRLYWKKGSALPTSFPSLLPAGVNVVFLGSFAIDYLRLQEGLEPLGMVYEMRLSLSDRLAPEVLPWYMPADNPALGWSPAADRFEVSRSASATTSITSSMVTSISSSKANSPQPSLGIGILASDVARALEQANQHKTEQTTRKSKDRKAGLFEGFICKRCGKASERLDWGQRSCTYCLKEKKVRRRDLLEEIKRPRMELVYTGARMDLGSATYVSGPDAVAERSVKHWEDGITTCSYGMTASSQGTNASAPLIPQPIWFHHVLVSLSNTGEKDDILYNLIDPQMPYRRHRNGDRGTLMPAYTLAFTARGRNNRFVDQISAIEYDEDAAVDGIIEALNHLNDTVSRVAFQPSGNAFDLQQRFEVGLVVLSNDFSINISTKFLGGCSKHVGILSLGSPTLIKVSRKRYPAQEQGTTGKRKPNLHCIVALNLFHGDCININGDVLDEHEIQMTSKGLAVWLLTHSHA